MANFPDTDNFAFSFSHATIKANNRVFSAIENIRLSQRLQEAAVYGTARVPLKRSAGQLEMGQGTLIFSDLSEAFDMLIELSPDPLFRTWSLDYTLVNESGDVRSIELQSCRMVGLDFDHSQGPDALPAEYPFSFMNMIVNGNDIAVAIQGLLAAAQVVQAVRKLF